MLEALDHLIAHLDQDPGPGPVMDGRPLPAALEPALPLVRLILSGPAPRESLLRLHGLIRAGGEILGVAGDPRARAALASLLSSGPELGRQLIRDPRRLGILADPGLGRAWKRDELVQDLDRKLSGIETLPDAEREAAFQQRLTAWRNDQYIRLAACEFGLSSLEQVGQELSSLADLCLDRAMAFSVAAQAREAGAPVAETERGPRPCGLTALAMGKYGAQELNFCSDIDIILLYETDRGQAGDQSLHEFYSRVCQRVVRLLGEPNREGLAFRVDLRLRPEGSQGPICNSLASAERYYETWGGSYDRLAWLKARAAAGDLALGREMIQIMRPFVYPRATGEEVMRDIQDLYRRITASLSPRARGWNVKLGHGGIRAVEFFVQALQLLHAGKLPSLQERASLRALDKLLFAGLITEREHRLLAEAYELWRHIEHRLQLYEGRQTHELPDSGAVRSLVARHMGYEPAAFDQELERLRARVMEIYQTLGQPGLETTLSPLLDLELPRSDGERLLAAAGFVEPGRAREQLGLLASKPWGPFAGGLAFPLLAEVERSPDPDAALQHLVSLALRCGPGEGLWRMLDQNRATLRLLCSLFGSSDHLARLFIDHPELMDDLLLAGRSRRRRTGTELSAELRARRGRCEQELEAQLNELRRFRNEEVLRIGLHDIAGGLDLEQSWVQLSQLAEVILEAIYPLILSPALERYGQPRHPDGSPATMTVLALGKLGSRELTYASDLDLIFVYSGPGRSDGPRQVDNHEFFSRVAQRMINALSMALEGGRLYEVDTRLRPSGNQGTLVSSLEGFTRYHVEAQPWERQVLIKARSVAGDLTLGERARRWIDEYVFQEVKRPDQLRGKIHEHRMRMEKELAGEDGDFYNVKLGRGGMLDVDFIVQYLQLRFGSEHPVLRVGSTLRALNVLEQEELMDPLTCSRLILGYRFLRRIESRLRIVRDRSAERLPASAAGLEVMARRLGYRKQGSLSPGAKLLQEYQESTESIRDVYRSIFGG